MNRSQPSRNVIPVRIASTMEYSLVFPATVEISDDSVVASGEIEIRHADTGLAPFTAFPGSIRVRDQIVLQYHIQADRISPQAN